MTRIRYGTPEGRAVLTATVLGSGVAFLDGSIVNVALPRMAQSLHAGFSTMQWVLDAYLLTLGAFVLIGGALGDVLGHRRVFVAGLVGFGVASALCAAAPTGGVLAGARAVQGLAGALLVPGSLALLSALFAGSDRDRAIGAWSGLAGLASAAGPFVGGELVDAASWRWVFLVNLPLVGAAAWVTLRHVPEPVQRDLARGRLRTLDLRGSALLAAALALLVVPLIEVRLPAGLRAASLVLAGAAAVAFVRAESRASRPMVPLAALRSRVFAAANAVTFAVYGALGGGFFLLAVQLQTGLGYSALEAGAATIPVTVLLLLFSSRVGGLAARVGARLLLTIGAALAGGGFLLLTRVEPGTSYVSGVLPGILVFAVGMCFVVAPITSTALGALDPRHAGLASGINNAVARVAALVAVAVLPAVAGAGAGTRLPTHGFQVAMALCGGTAFAGSLLAALALPRRLPAAAPPDSVAA